MFLGYNERTGFENRKIGYLVKPMTLKGLPESFHGKKKKAGHSIAPAVKKGIVIFG